MGSERSETTTSLLPVLQKEGEDEDNHGRKPGSAITKRGAYAAISYMASAGLSFTSPSSILQHFLKIYHMIGFLITSNHFRLILHL